MDRVKKGDAKHNLLKSQQTKNSSFTGAKPRNSWLQVPQNIDRESRMCKS